MSDPVKRDEGGRFLPGGAPVSNGRPPLPPWLKGHSEELLRLMLQAATTGRIPLSALPGEPTIETDDGAELPVAALWQEVPAKTRLAAAERVLDRIHGKAPLSVDVSEDAAAVLSAILRDKG